MDYPSNLHYGSGIFRRRIAIACLDNRVKVELEDCNHAFRLQLHHNGAAITGVDVEAIRYPLSTCGNAASQLLEFIGASLLEGGRTQLRKLSCPKRHCTHLYDMLTLGIAQSSSPDATRTYDVVVPDFAECTTVEVYIDGRLIHQWVISRREVIKPGHLRGRPLF